MSIFFTPADGGGNNVWKVSRETGRWLWLKSNQYNNHYYNNHSVKVQTNNKFEAIKVENRNMIKFHKNIWNIWKMKNQDEYENEDQEIMVKEQSIQ